MRNDQRGGKPIDGAATSDVLRVKRQMRIPCSVLADAAGTQIQASPSARSASPRYSASGGLERGNDLAGGGLGEPKAGGDEHHARVAFAAAATSSAWGAILVVHDNHGDERGAAERRIGQRLPPVTFLDRDGVVAPAAQLRRDERREHSVEQQLQRLSACLPASQAVCAHSLSER